MVTSQNGGPATAASTAAAAGAAPAVSLSYLIGATTDACSSRISTPSPQWRQFSFFSQTAIRDHHAPSLGAPEMLRQPALISTINAGPTSSSSSSAGRPSASGYNLAAQDEEEDLVLVADVDGNVHVLSADYEVVRTWSAYGPGGRCSLIQTVRNWKGIVVTIGEDSASPFPVLKIWYLSRTRSSFPESMPTLLRLARINPSSRPHPVSALSVSPGMVYIILGLADGTVVAFKHVDQLVEASLASVVAAAASNGGNAANAAAVLGLGKLRNLYSGKEPITGLGCTRTYSSPTPSSSGKKSIPSSVTLFILTTEQILSYPLSAPSSRTSSTVATPLDGMGANVGCSAVVRMQAGEKIVLAREEAIYVYGPEGRENCFAYEGPKSSIRVLSSAISAVPTGSTRSTYLAIVSPPLVASSALASATIRNYARMSAANAAASSSSSPTNGSSSTDVAKVTIFDPENKFVAYSGTFEEGVRDVWEAYGAVWVWNEGGKLFRLSEQPLQSSLATMYGKNLYTLAISLAQSRKVGASEVAEIYRRYGDHLYSKSDFEGAMSCYLKTVGSVQASYVIRKFLDAQRLSHLTSYLQELHARGLANSDHTTLLLNCYTKLADDTALSSFLHSSFDSSKPTPKSSSTDPSASTSVADEPPFDLETAIRVCRQAGYFTHASWLASRYQAHQHYLRIQIEDVENIGDALDYVRRLDPEVARDNLVKYGKSLLGKEPSKTTEVLIDLCCGTLTKGGGGENGGKDQNGGVGKEEKQIGGKSYMSYLAYGTSAEPAPPPPPAATTSKANGSRIQEGSSQAYPGTAPAVRQDDAASTPVHPSSPLPMGVSAALPTPRQFFAHFVDHTTEFIRFLETVAERRYGRKLTGSSQASSSDPLPEPQSLGAKEMMPDDSRDEQAIWNTLLELYLSPFPTISTTGPAEGKAKVSQEELRLQAKALQLLNSRGRIPYDETQALLVCSTRGFEHGLILLYEHLGLYEDIVRYWIEASSTHTVPSSRVITALRRYASSQSTRPRAPLYKMVLRHLTSSPSLLPRHSQDVLDLLDEIDRDAILSPISVVQLLSRGGEGGASIGLVKSYLKKRLAKEQQEVDAVSLFGPQALLFQPLTLPLPSTPQDQALIKSYRVESNRKRKEIQELSDPQTPRIFQVTRCSACGGQLDLPAVHFMCRHSYHQRCAIAKLGAPRRKMYLTPNPLSPTTAHRCLGESESTCPSCAQQHGMIRELRRANEALASQHEIFLAEVEEAEADQGFRLIANAFGKGLMGLSLEEGAAGK
ncbi:BQ5605_C003g02069 [Microbotryum silenes-dioicae]|uniref:BQ5605_C003g02069 protein n=1 Tax=Microbotryum silenes-dioicae TaxID=796604 RepID=A0A2X0MV88_9BASI|nr:BQ5605_C003g02069 [Microbotryum silenes-dioicae]